MIVKHAQANKALYHNPTAFDNDFSMIQKKKKKNQQKTNKQSKKAVFHDARQDTLPPLARYKCRDNLLPSSSYSPVLAELPRLEPTTGFRTLGIYITPDGSQVKQLQILQGHSEQFYKQLHQSSMTSSEAYTAFTLYFWPKLLFPLPCSSLSSAQCQNIQAPALAALLPKLHLNKHTSHALLFADYLYGGLRIPHFYVDQGYSQLKFFLGHLHKNDENSKLIRIALSHLQLQVGSSVCVLNLPFESYQAWAEQSCLTGLWRFLSIAQIKVELEHQWLPSLTREHDVNLMDFACSPPA